MSRTEKINNILGHISNQCERKRILFHNITTKETKARKVLMFTSAFLSLITAASFTGSFSSYFSANQISVVSAVLSLMSGAISLYVAIFLENEEIKNKQEGISALNRIVTKIKLLSVISYQDEEAYASMAADIINEYYTYSSLYDKYIGTSMKARNTEASAEELISTIIK